MVQSIIVFVIVVSAVAYLGRTLYRSFFSSTKGCATGCGKCGAVDFREIEKKLAKEKRFSN